jgi:Zn-finger nucleic acid-binding protein
MNCKNCGGAMELFASRGYFFCRYCGSFHFPESAGLDGIRILADGSPELGCAVCEQMLATAILDETHPVQYCRKCRGVFLPRAAFAAVVQKRRAWASEPPAPPVPLDRRELDRRVICPSCRNRMDTHPYYGPGNVVIDSCESCQAVWLDFGELRQIVNAPGQDRGKREHVPRSSSDATYGSSITGARMVGPGPVSGDDGPGDLLDFIDRLF